MNRNSFNWDKSQYYFLSLTEFNNYIDKIANEFVNFKSINCNEAFFEGDNTINRGIFYDFLHPTLKGYKKWAEKLKPYLIR